MANDPEFISETRGDWKGVPGETVLLMVSAGAQGTLVFHGSPALQRILTGMLAEEIKFVVADSLRSELER